jgi:hypothetical protein
MRMFLAAGFLMRQREYRHLPEDEGVNLSKEQIADYVQWLDLRDLKLVRQIAESIGDPEEVPIN